jgi:Alpha amylase, catalytic domain
MNPWPKHPVIYEINTWIWLQMLTAKHNASITLATVPAGEWDSIAELGVDAVWFMGVWERSPAGIAIANRNKSLLEDFRRTLSDFRPEDNVGSPYCVRRYVADEHLGGREGLAIARRELANRGVKLLLDFVPNHVAPDHPWVTEHPEYFVQGNADDARNEPASFVEMGGKIFACGRDPYFPAWPDVLQLNAFQPGLRHVVMETISSIASQCDGIRCDMAMLLLNQIFERTWSSRAGQRPTTEYWVDLISAIKKAHPHFLFIAEAYWDLEWELQQQGFDFCYDKRLYDRLEHENAESVRLHLCADLAYQKKLVRFIENHDEPRAASTFFPEKERGAAITTSTLTGAKLFHEGQFEGRKIKLPVFLGRRPEEPVYPDLRAFYYKLLKAINAPAFREGEWHLCERSGWPDNQSHLNLVAWYWRKDDNRYLIVVNLSGASAQALVRILRDDVRGKSWQLVDAFSGDVYERNGDEMGDPGFYVNLPAWRYHFFQFKRG